MNGNLDHSVINLVDGWWCCALNQSEFGIHEHLFLFNFNSTKCVNDTHHKYFIRFWKPTPFLTCTHSADHFHPAFEFIHLKFIASQKQCENSWEEKKKNRKKETKIEMRLVFVCCFLILHLSNISICSLALSQSARIVYFQWVDFVYINWINGTDEHKE